MVRNSIGKMDTLEPFLVFYTSKVQFENGTEQLANLAKTDLYEIRP